MHFVQEKRILAVSSMLYSKRHTARRDERDRRDTQLSLFVMYVYKVVIAVMFSVNELISFVSWNNK